MNASTACATAVRARKTSRRPSIMSVEAGLPDTLQSRTAAPSLALMSLASRWDGKKVIGCTSSCAMPRRALTISLSRSGGLLSSRTQSSQDASPLGSVNALST